MAVFLATLAAFWPSLGNGFIENWDDDTNLLLNPHIRDLGWENLRWMLSAVHNSHYHPLTWLSYALDYSLWGMNPAGFHATSLLLHAANALLFYCLSLRLLKASGLSGERDLPLAAGLCALLFGIHPLRVESVAWASERRDVLSGFFYLLTLLAYLRAEARVLTPIGNCIGRHGLRAQKAPGERPALLALSLACYASSLLSKAIGVSLPAVLLLLDLYPLRRLPPRPREWLRGPLRGVLYEKIPFAALALGMGLIGLEAETPLGAMRPFSEYGVLQRLAAACYGLAFYLVKTLLPVGLAPLYPMPREINPLDWTFLASALLAGSLTLLFFLLRRRFPAGLAAWSFYLLALAPVLGLVRFGPQIAADRYSYLSCLGWALLAGPALLRARALARLCALLAVTCLGLFTWRQTRVWRDSESLWTHAAASDPGNAVARNYLGNLRFQKGELAQAAGHYQEALRLDPGLAAAHNNLGNVLLALGREEEALAHYRQALRLSPGHWAAHYNMATALARKGRLKEAAAHYREELRINPGFERARLDLERVLRRLNPSGSP